MKAEIQIKNETGNLSKILSVVKFAEIEHLKMYPISKEFQMIELTSKNDISIYTESIKSLDFVVNLKIE